MLEPQATMKHIFETFSTLSDAQELISMGRDTEAIQTINHAKRHLNEVFQQDQNLLSGVMLNSALMEPCRLEKSLTQASKLATIKRKVVREFGVVVKDVPWDATL